MAAVALLLVLPVRAQPALSAPSPVTPSLSLPSDFAPLPLAMPGSRQALQKQVSLFLRRFDAIQNAEVLITGTDSRDLAARLVLKSQAGGQLTAEIIESVVQMTAEVVPGLSPQRVTIADSSGALLYRDGQVRLAALTPRPALPLLAWILIALSVATAITLVVVKPWSRPSRATGMFEFVSAADNATVLTLLSKERPETIGLVLGQLPDRAARRVRRLLVRRRVAVIAPAMPADPHVVQVVAQALQRKLR